MMLQSTNPLNLFICWLNVLFIQTAALQLDNSIIPKAWVVSKGVRFSTLDKLKLDDAPIIHETKGGKGVTVATKAIGLNFADIFTVLGLYNAANEVRGKAKSAFIPGLEFSGVVLNDPSGEYAKGDRVLGFTRFGAYADIVNVPSQFLKKLPNNWTFGEGASFIVQALTAWHGLVEIGRMPVVDGNNKKPFIVIVHSAAGGVGLWASEIAARRGGVVIGIVGNEAKVEVFRNRIKQFSPYSQAMIRGKEYDFKERLAEKLRSVHLSFGQELKFDEFDIAKMARKGYGADIVMESLGGHYFKASFDSLNQGGALITFGSTSYVTLGLGMNLLRLIYRYLTRPKIDPGVLTSQNIRLCGFNLIYLTENTSDLRRELNECIACLSGIGISNGMEDMVLDSIIPPVIGETFEFRTQAVDAMEMLKGGNTVGKVVLDNNENPCQYQ